MNDKDRIKKKVKVTTNGCWEWQGTITHKGYGMYLVSAHRFAYLIFVGPIPGDLQLDHLCKNKRCINPDHLEPVTAKENCRRSIVKTHCKRGHEFTPENTRIQIRGRYVGRSCKKCAAERQRKLNMSEYRGQTMPI